MKQNDLLILANLRENSRESLTKISRRTKIPVSTIFERMKNYDNDVVKKYTSIVDFTKLGFTTKAVIMITPLQETKDSVEEFLQKSKCVNSLYRVGTEFEYVAEIISKDLTEFHVFLQKLESLKIKQKEVLFVIEDLKKEEFLVSENLNYLGGGF